MQNLKYKVAQLTISKGQNRGDARIAIPSAQREVDVLVTVEGTDKPVMVNILENGTEIMPFVPDEVYNGRNGSFDCRSEEIPYQGGSDLNINAKTLTGDDVSDDVNVVLTFKIHLKDSYQC